MKVAGTDWMCQNDRGQKSSKLCKGEVKRKKRKEKGNASLLHFLMSRKCNDSGKLVKFNLLTWHDRPLCVSFKWQKLEWKKWSFFGETSKLPNKEEKIIICSCFGGTTKTRFDGQESGFPFATFALGPLCSKQVAADGKVHDERPPRQVFGH